MRTNVFHQRLWLLVAGFGSTAGALLHVVVVISGRADWYYYFEAPPWVVQSVRDGTWVGPVSGLIIAALMQAAGLFAFSAAGVTVRLPLLKSALVALSVIGILRGLLIVPLLFYRPERMPPLRMFDWVAAIIWALMGFCFSVGAWQTIKGVEGEAN